MMTMRTAMLLLTLAALTACGCGAGNPSSTQKPSQAIKHRKADDPRTTGASAWDDCAGQLDELCGQLLAYWSQKRQLPKTLEELAAFPGPHPNVPLACPESKKPYVYTPDSFRAAGAYGRIILHDPEPSHRGQRWVVAVREGQGGQLQAEPVRVPESIFALPPQPRP